MKIHGFLNPQASLWISFTKSQLFSGNQKHLTKVLSLLVGGFFLEILKSMGQFGFFHQVFGCFVSILPIFDFHLFKYSLS
jgi:hypothetical protein